MATNPIDSKLRLRRASLRELTASDLRGLYGAATGRCIGHPDGGITYTCAKA